MGFLDKLKGWMKMGGGKKTSEAPSGTGHSQPSAPPPSAPPPPSEPMGGGEQSGGEGS